MPRTLIITGVRPLNTPSGQAALEVDSSNHRPPVFPRAPREYIPFPDDEVAIMMPPAPPAQPGTSLFTTILPVVGVLLMVGFAVYSANATAQGQTGGIPVFALMSLPMALISFVGGGAKYFSDRKRYKQQLEARKAAYESYLEKKTSELVDLSQEQREASIAAHASLSTCEQIAKQRIPTKLWDRENGDPDFLDIRLGIGETSATFTVKAPDPSQFQIAPDPLEEKARSLVPRFSIVDNIAVTLPLAKVGAAGWVGKSVDLVKTVRSAIIHLATHHAPSEVKIVVLSSKKEAQEWDWVRWLPHNWSDGREIRFFANGKASQTSVMIHLENILKQRSNQQISRQESGALPSPVFVIVIADINIWRGPDAIKFAPIIDLILKHGPELGAFPLFLAGQISRVPKACKAIVDLQYSPANIKFLGTKPRKDSFNPDTVNLSFAWEFSQTLAPVRLEEAGGGAANLPGTETLTELIGASKLDEVNILEIWNQSRPFDTLAVPIGIGAGGKRLVLDVHEKAHGPHGLVAGTTGSGKTALLSTYLALAALHYHPHELGFIGIDFKGGDLIRDLRDLPHMIGTLTNLDGSGMDRAIKILRGEIKKRQNRFNQAGIGNIYEYQRMYRKKDAAAPQPMPHLVIVCDEFAELKKEQPEFIRELVSISRVGRSLGIHLILATQKPAGVVSDEIWANSHFHLCLKVASLEDSREMLRRPEAAEITQKGRAYFQVGMNEVFELFQAAWGDAPYAPEDTFSQQPHISRIRADGSREEIWPPKNTTAGSGRSQIQELVSLIIQTCQQNNIVRLDGIWPPALSEQAGKTLLEILPSLGWNGKTWPNPAEHIRPALGILDNPDQQRQEILTIDLENNGHFAIFGSPGTGKTTALQTLLTSLALQHTPEQVHMYLLDFSGRTLNILEHLPHVGAVITNGENERLRRLFSLLSEEMERRKKLVENDQNMNTYRANHPDSKEADIIVALAGYSHFTEAFKLQTYTFEIDSIVRIASQGGNLGIHLLVSTDQVKSFPSKLLGNIKDIASTELNDTADYISIVGRTGGLFPPKDSPGRGLFKDMPVKEFQAVLPAASPLEVKNLAEEMDKAWQGCRPRQVPVLPEVTALSDLLLPSKTQTELLPGLPVPLALNLSKPDLPFFEFSLKTGPHFWISGLPQSGRTSFLQTWLLALAEHHSPDNFRFVLVDLGWGNLEALKVLPHCIACLNDITDFKITDSKTSDLKEQLQEYLNLDFSASKPVANPDSSKPTVVFAVDGMGALQKGLADVAAVRNRDFLLSLLRVKNARFHMLVTGLPVEFGGGMTTNPIGEILRGFQSGIWLGDGTNGDAATFNFQFGPGELLKGLPKGTAFYVNRGKYTNLKLATCHVGNPSMEEWVERLGQKTVSGIPH
jgi:S-DNA-T family DNA segregation ATPase FtsK/SpoIIIE